jgi:hypothetical protein
MPLKSGGENFQVEFTMYDSGTQAELYLCTVTLIQIREDGRLLYIFCFLTNIYIESFCLIVGSMLYTAKLFSFIIYRIKINNKLFRFYVSKHTNEIRLCLQRYIYLQCDLEHYVFKLNGFMSHKTVCFILKRMPKMFSANYLLISSLWDHTIS